MRKLAHNFLCGTIAILIASSLGAEALQSPALENALWAVADGSAWRLAIGGDPVELELPRGTRIEDLQSCRDGWLAAGRAPADQGTELLLLRGGRAGNDLLPVPDRVAGHFRGRPVLAIHQGELVGMAWLEGDGARALEVRAAGWDGEAWGVSELVSPRGPGSQVAPRLTVLEDGSWLLVWAAFDGLDDEILWSRRRSGAWSPPQRLHPDNDVFDITPRVARTGWGAVAVWSRFDGSDYRLELSHFSGGVWSPSRSIGGRGSGDPLLITSERGLLLLFHTVESGSWSVLELATDGAPERLAEVAEATYERPLLLSDDNGAAQLVWPARDSPPRSRLEVPLDWRDLP